MEIGTFRFKKKFAFLPKKIYDYDLRNENRNRRITVWFMPYYEVFRYNYVTWAVPPKIGWSFDGWATIRTKKEIIKLGNSLPLYGKYDKLLTTEAEVKEQRNVDRQNYEQKLREYSEDRWLQGLVAGLNSR